MKGSKKKLLDIFIRFSVMIFLLIKAMSYECNKDVEKIAEVKKIIAELKSERSSENSDIYSGKLDNKKEPFQEIILKVARRYNVDPALIKAIIKVESHFNPYAISYKGAKGLMQLMPVTLKAMEVKDPFDPEYNIDAGVRYFKKLLIIFNDNIELALAAYNTGITKVRLYKGIPPFAKAYVKKVMRYYNYYKKEMFQLSNNQNT